MLYKRPTQTWRANTIFKVQASCFQSLHLSAWSLRWKRSWAARIEAIKQGTPGFPFGVSKQNEKWLDQTWVQWFNGNHHGPRVRNGPQSMHPAGSLWWNWFYHFVTLVSASSDCSCWHINQRAVPKYGNIKSTKTNIDIVWSWMVSKTSHEYTNPLGIIRSKQSQKKRQKRFQKYNENLRKIGTTHLKKNKSHPWTNT